jgi:hypothetical protein
MTEGGLGPLDLGSFKFNLAKGWEVHFFPSIETKVRLVKGDSVAIVEHYVVPADEAEGLLDSFYEDHILDLQRNVNGVIFFDEEDTEYEILVENAGEFRRYFFLATDRYIVRFTLAGSWESQDEEEIREMLRSISINGCSTELTDEMRLVAFNFDHQGWLRVGAMYVMKENLGW